MTCVLHSSCSLGSPIQSADLLTAHSLNLCLLPPPQVAEHSVQGVQVVQAGHPPDNNNNHN